VYSKDTGEWKMIKRPVKYLTEEASDYAAD
jgi:hypothetical protein